MTQASPSSYDVITGDDDASSGAPLSPSSRRATYEFRGGTPFGSMATPAHFKK